MALPPSKRLRSHSTDIPATTTIPIGIFVTQDSFEEVKQLMIDSANFAAFYAAAARRQTSASLEADDGGEEQHLPTLAPFFRNVQDCWTPFAVGKYSSKLFADVEQSYMSFSTTFQVPLSVEFRTLSGQLIHTVSQTLDWPSMRTQTVDDIRYLFEEWVSEEESALCKKRRDYLATLPEVSKQIDIECRQTGCLKQVPVLFEEITQRHIDMNYMEQGHHKKPCAKRDYVFRLIMDYDRCLKPELRYAGHYHWKDKIVRPYCGTVIPASFVLVDSPLLGRPEHDEFSDDDPYFNETDGAPKHALIAGNRTSIKLVGSERASKGDCPLIRFDGTKGAIARTKRVTAEIAAARERMKVIDAKVNEQFPALRTVHLCRRSQNFDLAHGAENLQGDEKICDLVDGCVVQDGNHMVLSWNILLRHDRLGHLCSRYV